MADGRKALMVALGALLLAAAPAAGQSVERSLAVAVLDDDGAPVPGLRAADFVVREDGVQREVLRVRQDTEPLQIALLVDTSEAAARAIGDFRKGLRGFIDAMDGDDRMAIIGFGGRPQILAASTSERAPLLDAADELFSSAGTAAYLLDALSETAEGFIKREASRPVLVVLATEGLDHSHSNVTSVLRTLEDAAITVQTVVLTGRSYGNTFNRARGRFNPLNEAGGVGGDALAQWRIDRDQVLQRGPPLTGGRRRNLVAHSGVERTMRAVAAELRSRYLVVYAAPGALIPPEGVDVDVERDDVSVRGVPVDAAEAFGR
ncbi:MAG: VWA domain-containing protein [Acidobacteria bacterium]|nr:VWA domain-containing protein [Acidobacteriota bacterium]